MTVRLAKSIAFAFGTAVAVSTSAWAGTVSAGDTGIGTSTKKDATSAIAIHGSATVTFSAPESKQTLALKQAGGVTGLGIWTQPRKGSNAGEREIEFGETLRASFSQGLVVSGIRLGLLFDGPEFNDVQEKALITATLVGGGTQSFSFRALYSAAGPSAQLYGAAKGASWANVQPPNGGAGASGVWDIFNPFGTSLITQLDFTAANPLWESCGKGRCTNPSDYVVMSVTAVPEPGTVALMLAGLGIVGVAARRGRRATPGVAAA